MTPEDRGSHVSILIENTDMKMFKQVLIERGIFGDLRRFEDDGYLMRISTVMYNTQEDCDYLVDTLESVIN